MYRDELRFQLMLALESMLLIIIFSLLVRTSREESVCVCVCVYVCGRERDGDRCMAEERF